MSPKYKKRAGTSGIRGHLYKSKLISLIYFRAKQNTSVRDFLLASNMDDVGVLNDICLRVKVRGSKKPLLVFLQAKHRDNDNSVLTLNSKHELTNCFNSYLDIHQAFTPQAKGQLFEGSFEASECLFVMYTTARDADDNKAYEDFFSKHLNDLIATGKNGTQPRYKQKDVDFLSIIVIQYQVTMLAKLLAKFICEDDGAELSMNNELMLRYHVLLARTVLSVSHIQRRGEEDEHRVAGFRQDFFSTHDEILKLFKHQLATQLLRNHTLEEHQVNVLLTSLFTEAFDISVLSELIESVVTYKEGKLHFVQEMDEVLKQQLFTINVTQATVEQAIEMAAERMLIRKTFKVPVTFGNNDLTVRGKLDVDIVNILNKLRSKILGLLRNSGPNNVIIIDDSLGDEFLQLNQGIASAVGNILIRDDITNSMKFTDEPEALGDLAKRLFSKVRQVIQDLHPYRFVVRTKHFPLLAFNIDEDGRDMELVKHEITTLAVTVAKFLHEEVSFACLMDDELVLRYHVVLEQTAIDVSDIQQRNEDEEHRVASFRQDLFDTHEDLLELFKHTLYMEILKRRNLEEHEICTLLDTFFDDTSDVLCLSKLIGNVVTYENGKLQFVHETTEDFKEKISRVNVSQSSVDEAVELAAREILTPKQFKVPAAFGNKDLTIKGQKGLKVERRLNHLKKKFSELSVMKIVTIDDSLADELLREGLAGAVGNILVLDKETNLLKFVDDRQSLGHVSGKLFQNLQSKLPDLRQYRFDVKIRSFPKLSNSFEDESKCEFEKKELSELAELFANFLSQETSVMSMDDAGLTRYHVILAEKMFDVSDVVQHADEVGEHRIASFRKDFFETNKKRMKLFKDRLYLEILRRRRLDENEVIAALQENRSHGFTPENVIILKHGNSKVFLGMPEDLKNQLNKESVTQLKLTDAIEKAVKKILTSHKFKVSTAFGNKDLTIADKSCDASEVLNQLTLKLCDLVKGPDVVKIATIDESLGDGLLKPSGGIGGLVGNLLVHDENTKLLKFTDNSDALEELSRRLFYKLSENHDMQQYRFVVKANKFPKVTFDSGDNDRRLAEDFLNRLLFFTSQADEARVGDILKGEIEDSICGNVNNFRVTTDALFLKYHAEIQAWWMDVKGEYLTKKSKEYEIAIKKIVSKPLMTVLGMMHQTRIRNNIECTFNDKVIEPLKLPPGTVVVTASTDLTVAKMIQRNKSQDHVVLDLEYVLNLQANEYNTLCEELRDTAEKRLLIVVCNRKPSYMNWSSRLKIITEAVRGKHTVVVTNNTLLEFIKEHFSNILGFLGKDNITNLADLTAESQKSVLKNATVVFQGEEVSLELLLDEESKRYVKGEVLNKVINNNLITVGKLVDSLNYEKIKPVFIDRQIGRANRTPSLVMSLNDVYDRVALLTGRPGMGKSTLLSHLSYRSRKLNPKLWIVRVNLLDYSEHFNNWKDRKTDINILESLTFLCEVVVSDSAGDEPLKVELEEAGGFVYLTRCSGDDSTAFELEMFLHFYNTKNMMFLFDGFDEIYPSCTDDVLKFLKVIHNHFSLGLDALPKDYKGPFMWITSGPNDEVKNILETEFGTFYELQMFPRPDQDRYLCLYWKSKELLHEFTQNDLDNLKHIINFIENGLRTYITSKSYEKQMHRHYSESLIKNAFEVLKYLKQKIIKLCSVKNIASIAQVKSIINDVTIFIIHYVKDFYTPLHLYLVTVYIYNQIKNVDIPNKWNFEVNSEFTIYERFIQSKMKKFSRKVSLGVTDVEKYKDFFDKHRQLGAAAIFKDDVEKIFTMKDVKEVVESRLIIKERKVTTGVVCGILNDIPLFLHSTFAECFAVHYICHIILINRYNTEKQKKIWDFILNVLFLNCDKNVRFILNYKIQEDYSLRDTIRENKWIIFELLITQGKGVYTYYSDDISMKTYLKIKQELEIAMCKDLLEFIELLYDLKMMLSTDYLEKLQDFDFIQLKFSQNTVALLNIKGYRKRRARSVKGVEYVPII